ncbi:hypothetical protein B0H17DRAFT_1220624 [Mycena rosella]|uniref:Uncharacterized protein n=1 Tax=Mycena rosella TaxID=1033263 RepID=A0AAD7B8V6_MYCRO|nr:hypothetical protein B0H17DRAFT_1220624 [Mycena rosella]
MPLQNTAANAGMNSADDSDNESQEGSSKGNKDDKDNEDEWEDEDNNTRCPSAPRTATTTSAAPTTGVVKSTTSFATPSSFFVPTSSLFTAPPSFFAPPSGTVAAAAPLTLHLTDRNGGMLHTASPAGVSWEPAFDFDDFDFDSLGLMDLSNTGNAPTLSMDDYTFLNSLPPILSTNATPISTITTSTLGDTSNLVPAAGASMGGSMSVFAVSTNTTAPASTAAPANTAASKKRKNAEQGGGVKKKTKPSIAKSAGNTASDKRKERSDKGTKRAGSMAPPERQHKQHSDKGKKRVPKAD